MVLVVQLRLNTYDMKPAVDVTGNLAAMKIAKR